MFEELSTKFEEALKTLKGENKISESNLQPALRLVKRALLDADVNLKITNEFLEEVRVESIGAQVVKGIRPEQKFVEIVHKKLTDVMGERNEPLVDNIDKPTIIMLVGLQGAGKTTAAAKLGLYLKNQGKKVMLIAADTFRPAAKDQLQKLGTDIGIEVFTGQNEYSSIGIAQEGVRIGKDQGIEKIIIDTAGRLYIDEKSMNEASSIKEIIRPDEVLLVVDSMIGQEAAELTKTFNDKVGITGAILTKLDGDSRGGAALSIKRVSGKPIKFIGTGEKVEALEAFYPDRLANRILGMGDILTLVDKAQKEVEIEDVLSMQKKFQEATFDFKDFLQQMKLIKRMGSLGGLMRMIPGMNKIDQSTLKAGELQLKKIEAMIGSMTDEERELPELMIKSQKRRNRVATGSGHKSAEVDKVIQDFERMRGMMKNLARGNLGDMKNSPMGTKDDFSPARLKDKPGQETKRGAKHGTKKRKGFFDL
jgi:signal recognition particle subunit SRP54